MKKEELIALGLSEEQVKEVFRLNGIDINASNTKVEQVNEELKQYKSQFEETKKQLDALKDLKPEELTNQVSELNQKLATQKADFEKQIAERDFNDLLSKSITANGGREVKAVIPFLEIEKLKQSKNQEGDIKTAIEAVKKDHDYLFTSQEPIKNPTTSTQSDQGGNNVTTDFYRSVMGLKTEEKK